jgi:hypothetical protein
MVELQVLQDPEINKNAMRAAPDSGAAPFFSAAKERNAAPRRRTKVPAEKTVPKPSKNSKCRLTFRRHFGTITLMLDILEWLSDN